jgi:hypothetical protein
MPGSHKVAQMSLGDKLSRIENAEGHVSFNSFACKVNVTWGLEKVIVEHYLALHVTGRWSVKF